MRAATAGCGWKSGNDGIKPKGGKAKGVGLVLVSVVMGAISYLGACQWVLEEEGVRESNNPHFGPPRQICSNPSWTFPRSVVGVSRYNSECHPSLTADGRYLYFNAAGEQNGPPYDPGHMGRAFNLYRAEWNGTAWGSVTWLGPNVNPGSYPTISPDGKRLYFVRGNKLWFSENTGTDWTPAQKLPAPINYPDPNVKDGPCAIYQIDATQFLLYFASDRPGGYGRKDIYVIKWDGSTWDSLTNLGPNVNTIGQETHPAISPDNKKLYLSDFGGEGVKPGWKYGDCDLYVSEWTGTEWGPAQIVGAPVGTDLSNCSCHPTLDGKLYLGSEVSEGGFGEEDIWVVTEETRGMKQEARKDNSHWQKCGELEGAWLVHCLIESQGGALYAGTAPEGQVFKSTDRGNTWTKTGELAGALRVYSLIETGDGSLYAGTYPLGKVFKSTNNGTTWTQTSTIANAKAVRALYELKDGTILAGTSPDSMRFGRIFKSTDKGTTWQKLGETPPKVCGGIFALYETEDGVLFAGGRTFGDLFFVSPNKGQTWNLANLPYDDAKITIGHIYFFKKTKDGTLWTGGWAHGPQGILLKSKDNGLHWDTIPRIYNGQLIAARIFDLEETDDGTLFIGFHPGTDSVCFKSTDNGSTWTKAGTLAGAREVLCLLKTKDGSLYAGTTADGDVFKWTTTGLKEEEPDFGVPTLEISPNPSRGEVKFLFSGRPSSLKIYDCSGRLVKQFNYLTDYHLPFNQITWDGTDESGGAVKNGVFFCELRVGNTSICKKVIKVQ